MAPYAPPVKMLVVFAIVFMMCCSAVTMALTLFFILAVHRDQRHIRRLHFTLAVPLDFVDRPVSGPSPPHADEVPRGPM